MASRLFFMAIHYVGTMHPGPLIEGLLLPLASDPNSGSSLILIYLFLYFLIIVPWHRGGSNGCGESSSEGMLATADDF